MNILSTIPEKIKPSTLWNGLGTGSADSKGIKPVGSNSVALLAVVTMAEATNLTLSVETGDDADGLNAVAITENIPIFVDNVRQTDGKSYEITTDSGSALVVFCVPSVLIPAGKYLCLSNSASHATNILSAVALNDVYHEASQA